MSARRSSSKRVTKRKLKARKSLDTQYAAFLREIGDRLERNTADEIERGIAADLLRSIANNEDVREQFFPAAGFYVVDEAGNIARKRGRRPRHASALDAERAKVDAFLRELLVKGISLKAAKDAAIKRGFSARSIRDSRARARSARNGN